MQHFLSSKSAFTLVEMLTVIAIIGILCAILLPAIGSVRDKAKTTHTKEILSQVADGWHLRYTDDRAFPPLELFTGLPGASATDDGDMKFPLSKQSINLLNWYNCNGNDPVDEYKSLVSKVDVTAKVRPQYSSNGKLLREQYFERNDLQWNNGILNSWGYMYAEKSDFSADNYIAWAVVDTGYDGKVTSPDGDTVKKSVIVYCPDKKGSGIICSWK